MDKINNFFCLLWKGTLAWRKMIIIFFVDTVKIIINPSYVMFSSVAIALATLGIWVEFISSGFSNDKVWYEQLNNLSVFTFCVALLGSMAMEYIFDDKWKDTESDAEKEFKKNLAVFFWFVALLLAFCALENETGKILGLSATILLWLYVNSYRDRFDRLNSEVLDLLKIDLKTKGKEGFNGDGL